MDLLFAGIVEIFAPQQINNQIDAQISNTLGTFVDNKVDNCSQLDQSLFLTYFELNWPILA